MVDHGLAEVFVLAAEVLHLGEELRFGEEQLLSMAVDQSDRYYYRLQDASDEVHSPGWVGVPHRVGVNDVW